MSTALFFPTFTAIAFRQESGLFREVSGPFRKKSEIFPLFRRNGEARGE
jgi:hypothetical protein